MEDILNSSEMQDLARMIEEAMRSTKEGVKYFVEPAQGTLRRAIGKRHHIVFGRRGSGKSSLLRKAGADLTVDRRPMAYVDLEAFKGHSYPDVLLSVLISTFQEFQKWINTAAIHPATKKTFWQHLFGSIPTCSAYNKKNCNLLSSKLDEQVNELKQQLHASDAAEIQTKTENKNSSEISAEVEGGISTPVAKLKSKIGSNDIEQRVENIQENFKRSKTDFLHRHILDYQKMFRDMAEISKGDSYLFLDDLYHIRRNDQPSLIDYFHRIAKGQNLWLKVGTIRHRTSWYIHGDPPIGVKLGDDADDIDLDLTLEKYSLAKDFLKKIITNFAKQTNLLPLNRFLTEGAVDRLVLASGGVARDFLSVFRRSIDIARQRGGPMIGAEDVNKAAGEHDTAKQEEFKKDTTEEEYDLDKEFQKIKNFCLDKANSNCFLIDKDAKGLQPDMIHELVDLKLLHLVRSRVTVSGRKGKIYEAYMLDLSQYAGVRRKRDLELVEFWKKDSEERLRRSSTIYIDT